MGAARRPRAVSGLGAEGTHRCFTEENLKAVAAAGPTTGPLPHCTPD